MVAGEASGDLLASRLIDALKRRLPGARFFGVGGPNMQRAGFEALYASEKLAVRGYVEVLRHFPEIATIRGRLTRLLLDDPPDAFIGIDAPDFNLALERKLKARGITTIHYVSPSIWAWRGGRIDKIGRAVDHLLALFPFEAPLYERRGIPVTCVGHPLADLIGLEPDTTGARRRLGLSGDGPVIALLPGSRQSELQYMAPTFIETARRLYRDLPGARFLVPLASRETRVMFDSALRAGGAAELPITVMFGHAHDALEACDAVLVASGTATLEALLFKKPMVIAYRISPWTYRLVRRMVYQPYFGLPNILAGRFVVPEFIQDEATPENLAQAIENWLADRVSRERLARLFVRIHEELRRNAAEKAAGAVLACLNAAGQWNRLHRQPA
jgi:lipid-A-disaccharide synthase